MDEGDKQFIEEVSDLVGDVAVAIIELGWSISGRSFSSEIRVSDPRNKMGDKFKELTERVFKLVQKE